MVASAGAPPIGTALVVPASVFGIHEKGRKFTARVESHNRNGTLDVRFDNDNRKYWFPRDEVRKWVKTPKKEPSGVLGKRERIVRIICCEFCDDPNEKRKMMTCAGCSKAWHCYCLLPTPLVSPPDDTQNWRCEACSSGSGSTVAAGHQHKSAVAVGRR